MVFSFPRHAAHRGVAALLLMALTASPPLAAHAGTPAQRQELAAALRQLDALERFVAQSAANTPITAGERRCDLHDDLRHTLPDHLRGATAQRRAYAGRPPSVGRAGAATWSSLLRSTCCE